MIQLTDSAVFPRQVVPSYSPINNDMPFVAPLPDSCSETTLTSILNACVFSSDDEFSEENIPARDALPGGLGSGLVNESIQSLDAMIEQQYQESGVTRESHNSFDTEANSSDQSKELDSPKEKAKRNKHHSKICSNRSYNSSILARRSSLKSSMYTGIEFNQEAASPTNENTEGNGCYTTESDTCSNNKTVLFATPAYQFDYFQWSRKQPLKMNEILKGDETVTDHQSYPTTSDDDVYYAALTSEKRSAMIHEITTQLATKLTSDGANTNVNMAEPFNPPCHSSIQALNPENSSPMSSFYASNHHTASAATVPPSHHQSAIRRNFDGRSLAVRYAQRHPFLLEGDNVPHDDDDSSSADIRPSANSNSDVENGRPHKRTKERWLSVCLVMGFVMPLAWVVGGWFISGVDKETEKQLVGRAALELDDDPSSQQSDLNGPHTDDVPRNNRNSHNNESIDSQATRLGPSDEPELDLWTPRINLTTSAANVTASFPAQYRPFTSMPNLFMSSPPTAITRNSISSPNLLGLYEPPQPPMPVSESGTLESSILPVPVHSFTSKDMSATPSPTPTLVNLSPTNFTRHWNPTYGHRPTPYPVTLSGSNLTCVPAGPGHPVLPSHYLYHLSVNDPASSKLAPPAPTGRPSFVSNPAWLLDRCASMRTEYPNGGRNTARFWKNSLARKKMRAWLPGAHPHPLVRANRWMMAFAFLLGCLTAICFMLVGIKSKMNQARVG